MLPRPSRSIVLYIAGPFTAGHGRTEEENITAAKKVAEKYFKMGYTTITPHVNTWHMEGCKYQDYLDADFEVIRRCDAIVMMKNWRESGGATQEHNLALERYIPIHYDGGA